MAVNSINTNIAAYYAQANISLASQLAANSVARLSSGNRIVQAGNDVAALATGTLLATNVATLRTALTSAAQGTSLLQVADGALSQISNILQQQKSLAQQAASGDLTDADRAYLDLQFQSLADEIDRLAGTTNFNGVNLLDGSLSEAAALSALSANATSGSLSISFADNIIDGETVIINGVTLTAETDSSVADLEFAVGATTAETVQNLAARLNQLSTDNSLISTGFTSANKLAISEAKYEAVGNTLVITARAGGSLSNSFRVSTSGTATVNNEASYAGSYLGTSFNLFTAASSTSITSTSYVLSDTGGSADADPFDVGESLTLTIGGVERTLITFTSGGGTGASGAYTLQDVVNGINANSVTTGVKASVVYNGTSYNIRLSYNSLNGVAILNGGDSYDSTTFKLTGDNIDLSGSHTATVGDDLTKSIIATDGYRNLVDTDLATASVATQAQTVVHATTPAAATPFLIGNNIRATVNGVQYVLHTFVAADGLDDIVASINAKTGSTGIYAVVDAANGTDLNIRLYVSDPSGVAAASGIALSLDTGNHGSAATTAGTVIANATSGVTRNGNSGLAGGANNGVGQGSTALTASSVIGDNILAALSQAKAESRILLTSNATAGNTLQFGDKVFYFTATTSGAAPNEILIGSTIAETLDNAVKTLNRYFLDGHAVGTEAFEFNQVNITRVGDAIVFRGKKLANVLQADGTAVTIATNVSGASVTSANLSNAVTSFGVDVSAITNSAFVGTISGFNVTYTGTADQGTISVKIGKYTYTAEKVDFTIASNTTVRLFSDTLEDGTNGGYFDIQLRANEVLPFSDQAGATVIANRLNAAFSSISFVQQRNVSSYDGTSVGSIVANSTVIGSLVGTSVTAQLSSFTGLKITSINVTAPSGSNTDTRITLTIGGVNYSTAVGIGSTLGANQTYRLISEVDPNQFVEFTTGNSAIDISSAANAAAVQAALKEAFGVVEGSAALTFQLGSSAAESLRVSINDARAASLYGGQVIDILTQENANAASAVIDDAITAATTIRATVGALQQRFDFAAAGLQTSIQNQDAARAQLLDTDIATESTAYATAQVKLQAGISVLAQANQQLQSLLKLIG